jgi:hypothetical protein
MADLAPRSEGFHAEALLETFFEEMPSDGAKSEIRVSSAVLAAFSHQATEKRVVQ